MMKSMIVLIMILHEFEWICPTNSHTFPTQTQWCPLNVWCLHCNKKKLWRQYPLFHQCTVAKPYLRSSCTPPRTFTDNLRWWPTSTRKKSSRIPDVEIQHKGHAPRGSNFRRRKPRRPKKDSPAWILPFFVTERKKNTVKTWGGSHWWSLSCLGVYSNGNF